MSCRQNSLRPGSGSLRQQMPCCKSSAPPTALGEHMSASPDEWSRGESMESIITVILIPHQSAGTPLDIMYLASHCNVTDSSAAGVRSHYSLIGLMLQGCSRHWMILLHLNQFLRMTASAAGGLQGDDLSVLECVRGKYTGVLLSIYTLPVDHLDTHF